MIDHLFLKYLLTQPVHCAHFNLVFENIRGLSGNVLFKSKMGPAAFKGKFVIHHEPFSNKAIITIALAGAVFKSANKNNIIPESLFVAETETFQEKLDSIDAIESKNPVP